MIYTTIIVSALEILKEIFSLSKKVLDSTDSEKHAKSVNALNVGVSDTYAKMREIIVNCNKFSDEEKIQKLAELAEQEKESKEKCNEMILENRKNVTDVIMTVLKGFLTCGISFAPEIIKGLKSTLGANAEFQEIELTADSIDNKY